MTEPYRPDIRWQVDWNGNGRFDHPASDVTSDVHNYTVRWGSAADTPQAAQVTRDSPDVTVVGGILSDTAVGSLELYDRDGRFDPDNVNLAVDEENLRVPVQIRRVDDGFEVWRGIGLPRYGVLTRSTEVFSWDLVGLHGEAMKARVEILEPNFGLLSQVTDDADVPLNLATRAGGDVPLGLVTFAGARIKYFEAFGRLAGGWVLEDERGNWFLRTLLGASETTPVIELTLDYERYEGAVLRELESLVRTRCRLASQSWQVVREDPTDAESPPRKVSVGSATYNMRLASQITVEYRMRGDDTRSVNRWLDPEAIGATVTAVRSRDTVRRAIRFTLSSVTGGEAIVNFFANISAVTPGHYRDVILGSSEEVYGGRDLGLEPWLNANHDSGEKVVVPWLDNLSEPLEYFRVTFPEWQNDPNRYRQLRAAKPGETVRIDLPTQQGGETTKKCLVLAVRMQGGNRRIPTRTLYGVVARGRRPEPLVAVSAEALSPFEVQALVRLSDSDPAKTMYTTLDKVT